MTWESNTYRIENYSYDNVKGFPKYIIISQSFSLNCYPKMESKFVNTLNLQIQLLVHRLIHQKLFS